MRDGGRDFRTGEPIEAQTFFDDKIDIHHIFPEKWCKTAGIEPGTYNSVINKTAISARTNRQIGGKAPSSICRRSKSRRVSRRGGWTRSSPRTASRPRRSAPTGSGSSTPRAPRRCSQRIEAATGKTIAREPELFRAGVVAEALRRRAGGGVGRRGSARGSGVMRLPPYPKYKPSGVEWLGEVPEHWDMTLLHDSSTRFSLSEEQTPDKRVQARVLGGFSGHRLGIQPKDMKRRLISRMRLDHVSIDSALRDSPASTSA